MIDYLSLWIANFGVEPLLAIMFFLAFPAFFLLNFLLVRVCCVFEAIIYPLNVHLYKIKGLYLSILINNVKIFVFILACLAQGDKAFSSEFKDIFISKGEQYELQVKNIKRYSIGNKEVIKHKFQKRLNKILVKGKQIGFSDIIIWSGNKKLIYHIYVISKKEHLKKMSLIDSLKRLNLEIKVQGEIIYVQGLIDTHQQYMMIHKLIEMNYKNLIFNLNLSTNLKNEIVSRAMNHLYKSGAEEVICDVLDIDINCATKGLVKNKKLELFLKNKLFVDLSYDLYKEIHANYLASFKIIQISTNSNHIQKLGIDKVAISVKEALNFGNEIVTENLYLGSSDYELKTLAEPQTVLTYNKKGVIQLGGELPFQNMNNQTNTVSTQWKFYGLQIKLLLKNDNQKKLINYSSELTTPSEGSIVGSKGQSSLYINEDKYIKLFEVGHTVDYAYKSYLPVIGEIPFLKNLFSSKETNDSYKHILCFLKLEKIHE